MPDVLLLDHYASWLARVGDPLDRSFEYRHDLWVTKVAAMTEALGKIDRADEQTIDPFDRQEPVELGERVGRLDLHDDYLLVGVGGETVADVFNNAPRCVG